MGALEFTLKAIENPQSREKEDAPGVWLIKYEHDITAEDASDVLPEGTPTFDVEITVAIKFTIKGTNDGALVNAKELTKQFNKRWTWGGALCSTWSCT